MASTSSSSPQDILQQPLPPSASPSMVYDAFLNYSGCDVKEGLATDIYDALNRMRRRVFIDQQVLEYGDSIPEEVEVAMRNASVCIAIFSPNYAESSWCLEELSFMVKNKKKIIPIFYNVEPSDLRWVAQGKGVYVEAFKKSRSTPQKLEEWKTALYNVSFFFGHELKKNKEDKGRLLKSIVESVLKHMPLPLEVAQHPVGLDEIVEDFENTFKSSDREQHVDIVGIIGMGGSGKTTLSKELYNKKCLKIARHSFISEVRDAASKNTLHNKQEKLLRDLLSEKFNGRIDHITEGKGVLRARLRSLRVLIVLDDVDHVDQIDAMLPEKGCIFAPGSLIIVTTRESDVLRSFNISCIYKMKPLNPIHARHLFCWHAFMQSDPVQEFEDLVKKVMNSCQGLPLSLKVLGAQLYKRPKDYWVSQLDDISRILPKDIMKILKISFDALDTEQKDMYLDTACFFLGEEKSLAIEVWNGSGLCGLCDWETLLSKCLVELDQQNHICMHDQLRDLGRQIAMERARFRLFPSADLNMWRQAQEKMLIRGIMETSTGRSHWPTLAAGRGEPSLDYRPLFKEYMELKPSICEVQLLVAENSEFSEEYAMLSKELRWLRLFNFQKHSCLPSWLSLENLRVLELYGAPNLKELWQDNVQQPPLQLRELIIHHGALRRFPSSIGSLRHLKKLSCMRAGSVENLPEGFCNLQSLEHLELLSLWSLSSLPSCFGDLTNLRHLNLGFCYQLKMLPDSFKQLKHLQYLNLLGCSKLTFTEHNADILENITKLEDLNFNGCEGLQVLPHHITKQAFLREVDLKETSLSELPDSIGQLKRLEVLSIGSAELESLPYSLGNLSGLTHLQIRSCTKLESLPHSLGNLSSLIHLEIRSCKKLESLPDSLGNLCSLTHLHIEACEKVRSLPESLGRLALLESIEIWYTGVESLPKALGHLISLQNLRIQDSPIRELIFEFEDSSALPRLKDISLGGTRMSTMSIPEHFCPSLESLSVRFDDFLVEIRTLPRTVKTITLANCERLKDIAGIGSLQNLQRLIIDLCPELAELPSFAELASLKQIKIIECQFSGKMEGLEQLTSLETLSVQTQWEVPGITSLEQAQGLRRLRLSADKIGALEPCIKTLQKWPGEVTICARALGGVESVVKAFTSSNLMVVEACADGDDGAEETERKDEDDVDDKDDGDEEADVDRCTLKYRKEYWSIEKRGELWKWRLGDAKTCLSHEATIVCFVINCLSGDAAHVWVWTEEEGGYFDMIKLREGKWVLICAVSHGIIDERHLEIELNKGHRVEKGLLGTGEEREVKDVFSQVLDALKM